MALILDTQSGMTVLAEAMRDRLKTSIDQYSAVGVLSILQDRADRLGKPNIEKPEIPHRSSKPFPLDSEPKLGWHLNHAELTRVLGLFRETPGQDERFTLDDLENLILILESEGYVNLEGGVHSKGEQDKS